MTDPTFLAVTAEIRMGLLMAAFEQVSSLFHQCHQVLVWHRFYADPRE